MTYKLIKISFLVSVVSFFLAACGSDSGTDSGPAQAETVYGLGECEESNDGVIKLVTSEDQYYKCVDGDWEETEAPLQSSSSKNSQFARSSSSNNALSGLGKQSSTSSGFFSTDSKSGYNPVNQTLTDSRDGQVYRTTTIDIPSKNYSEVWMAENLNLVAENSWCGGGNGITEGDCSVYGRLYTWAAAVAKPENECGNGHECGLGTGDVRGICPKGWHLPSQSEWSDLFTAVGGSSSTANSKLKNSTGWNRSGNGTDNYGFSALPAGSRVDGDYNWWEDCAYFWSSTEGLSHYAHGVRLCHNRDDAYLNGSSKDVWLSVRCLKD